LLILLLKSIYKKNFLTFDIDIFLKVFRK